MTKTTIVERGERTSSSPPRNQGCYREHAGAFQRPLSIHPAFYFLLELPTPGFFISLQILCKNMSEVVAVSFTITIIIIIFTNYDLNISLKKAQ